jgi:hypothetical protein
MRELSPEQLDQRFPHGYYIETKIHRKKSGEIVRYRCRRARPAPKHRDTTTKDIHDELKNVPHCERHRVLELIRELAIPEPATE